MGNAFINMTLEDGDSYDPVRSLTFNKDGSVLLENEFDSYTFTLEQIQGAVFTDIKEDSE